MDAVVRRQPGAQGHRGIQQRVQVQLLAVGLAPQPLRPADPGAAHQAGHPAAQLRRRVQQGGDGGRVAGAGRLLADRGPVGAGDPRLAVPLRIAREDGAGPGRGGSRAGGCRRRIRFGLRAGRRPPRAG